MQRPKRFSGRLMMHCSFRTAAAVLLILTALINSAAGQVTSAVTPDGSLGTEVILNGNVYEITQGSRFGGNLFHSLREFSVDTGEVARFTNDSAMPTANIISRVTGGARSNIYGEIETSGFPGATLFLLNSAGIVFGPGAVLDVEGSFHATTAGSLELQDGGVFWADDKTESVLSASPPSAFGFLDSDPASIEVRDSTLELRAGAGSTGHNLSLIGGDIAITRSSLGAPGGQVAIVSAGSGAVVELPDGAFAATQGTSAGAGSVMVESSRIDVGGNAGGEIVIRAGQLEATRSSILSEIQFSLLPGSSVDDATESSRTAIDINVDGSMRLSDGTVVSSSTAGSEDAGNVHVRAGELQLRDNTRIEAGTRGIALFGMQPGRAGDIIVDVEKLSLANGSQVVNRTNGFGASGKIEVTSADAMAVSGTFQVLEQPVQSGLFTETAGAQGAGSIVLSAGSLSVEDGGAIRAASSGAGESGDIAVTAGAVSLAGDAQIDNRTTASGAGGALTLVAREISVQDGARITASTLGAGTGGTIDIAAGEGNVLVAGRRQDGTPSSIATAALATAQNQGVTGDAGAISIRDASEVIVRDGASVSATTSGTGDGGTIRIDTDTLTLNDGVVSAGTSGPGAGGSVTVNARQGVLENNALIEATSVSSGSSGNLMLGVDELQLTGGARITNQTSGDGIGGTVTIGPRTVGGTVTMRDIGTAISTEASGAGDAGDLLLTTGFLTLKAGAGLTASTSGSGDGGSIEVHASQVKLTGGALTASTSGAGLGGSVMVTAERLDFASGSTVSARSIDADGDPQTAEGMSGSISINATDALHLSGGSEISVKTDQADAGTIDVEVTNMLRLQGGSEISTSAAAGQGNGGNIDIDPIFVILDEDSMITASALRGSGGNINIVTEFFLGPVDNVNAASELGVSGVVDISGDVEVAGETLPLPANFLDAASLLSRPCASRLGGASSLVATGHQGLPVDPDSLLAGSGDSPGFGVADLASGSDQLVAMALPTTANVLTGCL